MSSGDEALSFVEVIDDHGTRLHVTEQVPAGATVIHYSATVGPSGPLAEVHPIDPIRYLRPSRYCASDALGFGPLADVEFPGLEGGRAARRQCAAGWEHARATGPGSSRETDGASDAARPAGVCRDFAHLVIAAPGARRTGAAGLRLCARAVPDGLPRRGRGAIDGAWRVVDATGLAPRQRCCGSPPAATPPTPPSSTPTRSREPDRHRRDRLHRRAAPARRHERPRRAALTFAEPRDSGQGDGCSDRCEPCYLRRWHPSSR